MCIFAPEKNITAPFTGHKQKDMEEKENPKVKKPDAPGSETPPQSVPSDGAVQSQGWRDLLRKRSEDLDVDDDSAVSDYLRGEFDRLDRGDEASRKMNDILTSEPRYAGLLSGMLTHKTEDGEEFSLVDYLVEHWFDELKESASREDLIERVNKKLALEEEQLASRSAREKEAEENFKNMNDALTSAIVKTGIDNETAQKVLDWLYGTEEDPGLFMRIPEKNVSEDDWVRLIHAFTRDKSLDEARQAGIREGRATRPGQSHRSSSVAVPADLGGGSGTAPEEQDENPTVSRYRGMRPRYSR